MSEAQTIYRSFLKVIQKWPVDKVRPNRDLKQILATRVEESFRNEQTLNVQDAKKQLIALEKLLNNDFKARVSVYHDEWDNT
jgi:hypothetical protein